MLDGVSCWYFDWATIGTWVGGLGAASAAWAAVWSVKRQEKSRKDFAKYLFRRDIGTIQSLLEREVLHSVASAFAGEQEMVTQDLVELRRISLQLEYFGKSDKLFAYSGEGKNFSELNAAVDELIDLDKFITWMEDAGFGGDELSESLYSLQNRLTKSIEKL
ncbi:MAG: hypothetical protein KA751_07245 [Comamonas sp.]|jgi:hypothetical protein|nr:hypothetical protein [Comamonas sp.]